MCFVHNIHHFILTKQPLLHLHNMCIIIMFNKSSSHELFRYSQTDTKATIRILWCCSWLEMCSLLGNIGFEVCRLRRCYVLDTFLTYTSIYLQSKPNKVSLSVLFLNSCFYCLRCTYKYIYVCICKFLCELRNLNCIGMFKGAYYV